METCGDEKLHWPWISGAEDSGSHCLEGNSTATWERLLNASKSAGERSMTSVLDAEESLQRMLRMRVEVRARQELLANVLPLLKGETQSSTDPSTHMPSLNKQFPLLMTEELGIAEMCDRQMRQMDAATALSELHRLSTAILKYRVQQSRTVAAEFEEGPPVVPTAYLDIGDAVFGDELVKVRDDTERIVLTNVSGQKAVDASGVALGGFAGLREVKLDEAMLSVCELRGGFFYDCPKLEKVDLRHLQNVQTIGERFFSGAVSLQSIDLASWANLERIGDKFLAGCTSMRVPTFPAAMPALKEIGDDFLQGCSSLRSLDTSSWMRIDDGSGADLKTVGRRFLAGCEALSHVDLSALHRTTVVGARFMSGCDSLAVVDLTPIAWQIDSEETTHQSDNVDERESTDANTNIPGATPPPALAELTSGFLSHALSLRGAIGLDAFESVSAIGDDFLRENPLVANIVLPHGRKHNRVGAPIATVGSGFLADCCGLEAVALAPLRGVAEIGNFFLCACHKLVELDLHSLSPSLMRIGTDFLRDCTRLESVDFSDIGELLYATAIPSGLLRGCVSLKVAAGVGGAFPVAIRIGDHVMADCSSIVEVDFTGAIKIEEIGDGFMRHCVSLQNVTLSPLLELVGIGCDAFLGCRKLVSLELSQLTKLLEIGDNFARDNSSLPTLRGDSLLALETIGENFLADCVSLVSVDVSPYANVKNVGRGFLANTPALLSVFVAPQSPDVLQGAVQDAVGDELQKIKVVSTRIVEPSGFKRHSELIVFREETERGYIEHDETTGWRNILDLALGNAVELEEYGARLLFEVDSEEARFRRLLLLEHYCTAGEEQARWRDPIHSIRSKEAAARTAIEELMALDAFLWRQYFDRVTFLKRHDAEFEEEIIGSESRAFRALIGTHRQEMALMEDDAAVLHREYSVHLERRRTRHKSMLEADASIARAAGAKQALKDVQKEERVMRIQKVVDVEAREFASIFSNGLGPQMSMILDDMRVRREIIGEAQAVLNDEIVPQMQASVRQAKIVERMRAVAQAHVESVSRALTVEYRTAVAPVTKEEAVAWDEICEQHEAAFWAVKERQGTQIPPHRPADEPEDCGSPLGGLQDALPAEQLESANTNSEEKSEPPSPPSDRTSGMATPRGSCQPNASPDNTVILDAHETVQPKPEKESESTMCERDTVEEEGQDDSSSPIDVEAASENTQAYSNQAEPQQKRSPPRHVLAPASDRFEEARESPLRTASARVSSASATRRYEASSEVHCEGRTTSPAFQSAYRRPAPPPISPLDTSRTSVSARRVNRASPIRSGIQGTAATAPRHPQRPAVDSSGFVRTARTSRIRQELPSGTSLAACHPKERPSKHLSAVLTADNESVFWRTAHRYPSSPPTSKAQTNRVGSRFQQFEPPAELAGEV